MYWVSLRKYSSFLAPICKHFPTEKKNTWQLVQLRNLYICLNQKFIQCDFDETMTMLPDAETTKCFSNTCWLLLPNQKNIYGAGLALNAIMYDIMQGIIAVASLLATIALYGNGSDPQWCMSGIHNMYYSYHCSLIGQSTIYL